MRRGTTSPRRNGPQTTAGPATKSQRGLGGETCRSGIVRGREDDSGNRDDEESKRLRLSQSSNRRGEGDAREGGEVETKRVRLSCRRFAGIKEISDEAKPKVGEYINNIPDITTFGAETRKRLTYMLRQGQTKTIDIHH